MTDPDLVLVDDETGVVDVPHWGITLRRLFGACLAAQVNPEPGARQYVVRLKGAPIAIINVRQHDDFFD